MTGKPMTYAGSGVDYGALDRFKRMAQLAAAKTDDNLARLGFSVVAASRGESVFLIDAGDCLLAHVEEGLGTKILVADVLRRLDGSVGRAERNSLYAYLAQDTVAMIVNDMITLGALPLSVAMHLAVGSSGWFDDLDRLESLTRGWKHACDLAGCVWGGGETPTLKDIVVPGTAVLSGSAIGAIKPKERRILGDIQPGDAIVMLASSGVHSNGLSLARQIADRVGYTAVLSDGRGFAEALLDPTTIYVPVIEAVLNVGVKIHYAVNITGHGWRKLMRAVEPFVYLINRIPEPQPVFRFIQERGPVSDAEMYGNFNMGAGFAIFLRREDAAAAIAAAKAHGIEAWVAGGVEKRGDEKKVVIEPLGLVYDGSTLEVR